MSSLALEEQTEHVDQTTFEDVDEMRRKALEYLETAEIFYTKALKSFPERCTYELAHERGKIDAMAWQTHQLKAYGSVYFSQSGQDYFIDNHIFNGKRDGTFVEIGGYDGLSYSNCLFFEAIRGWRGLFVEPSPEQMEKAKTIRQSECMELALGNQSQGNAFINITDGFAQMSGLQSSFSHESLSNLRSHPEHAEKTIEVSVMTLEALLNDKNLTTIDLCSLDIGGGEYNLISEFPFDEINVSCWCIDNKSMDKKLGELLVKNGYQFITVLGYDEIYYKA